MIHTRTNGFTLVELAVSMVVIGILLGLGVSMVKPLMNSIKVRESRESLNASVESINSYAAGNNRLPDTTLLSSVVSSPKDAWGRDFIYLYDANLYTASPTKDTICGRRSTVITLTDSNTSAVIPNVAFVLLSQADDAATNTTIGGTAVTTGSRTTTTAITADTVSDLVRWVTLDELRTKAGCQGAQLKIVNNELPYGYNQTTYNATIFADGGVPFSSGGNYRWCIQNTAGTVPANMTFKNSGATADIPFNTNCSGLAEASWVQSDSIVIGGLPTVNVTGSDGKVYSCTQNHTAAAGNLPISGASWATYWQLAPTGSTGSTWTSGRYYTTMSQSLTVFVRDNNDASGSNDNVASKIFSLTINSQ